MAASSVACPNACPLKLLHVITFRLLAWTAAVLAFWAVLFYFAVMDEVEDETDDSLEDYAELIIVRSLAGEPLPSADSGTNNQFYLHEVSPAYAAAHSHVRYEDREVYIRQKRETEPARVLTYIFRHDDGRWMELEVSTPHIDKADLRRAIFGWLVCLYGAFLVCLVVVNVWAVRRSMRPLRVLLDWLDNYRLGHSARTLRNPTRIDEFRKLNEAVARSTERNERSFEQQKRFIGNASHEMQTPLAVCCGRIEMMLEDESLPPAQVEEIVKVLHTLQGLSRMNRSLLLLCKIDNGQFPDAEPVDVGAVVGRLLPDYESAYASRRIRVSLGQEGQPVWQMDAGLAATLVGNLLKNAFVHNVEGGEVRVSVSASGLRVANTGVDTPLDPKLIFARFYHTPGKRSSTGLGLSVVKAIGRLYGLSVDYAFENGLHVFSVRG